MQSFVPIVTIPEVNTKRSSLAKLGGIELMSHTLEITALKSED